MPHRLPQSIARGLLVLVYTFSAITKLVDPFKFYSFSATLPLISVFNPRLLLILVAAFELLLSAGFLFRPTIRIAALSSMSILFVFTLALVYASMRGVDMACGCFGEVLETSPEISIVRNVLLIVLSAFSLVSDVTLHQTKGAIND